MRRLIKRLGVAVAIAILLVNCGGGGSTGTNPSPGPQPQPVTVSSLGITAPWTSARIGQSERFTATATMSNGTTQNVTSQAQWQSSNASVASVSTEAATAGQVTAHAPGSAEIRASYQGASAAVSVTVAAATFNLCGTVRDASTNQPVGGVRVEILTGPNTGKITDTANDGTYCLNDLQPGSINVRADKNGYDRNDQSVTLSANGTLDFSIRPTPAPSPSPVLVARPGGPYGPVNSGSPLTPDGRASTSTPFPIAHYYWDCGQAGNTNCRQDTPTPRFIYTKTGALGTTVTYTITLTIEDTQGNRATATTTVRVSQVYGG